VVYVSACLCVCLSVRLSHGFFLQDSICAAFNAGGHYTGTFEVFLKFYRENESLDLKKVSEEEHGRQKRYAISCASGGF